MRKLPISPSHGNHPLNSGHRKSLHLHTASFIDEVNRPNEAQEIGFAGLSRIKARLRRALCSVRPRGG